MCPGVKGFFNSDVGIAIKYFVGTWASDEVGVATSTAQAVGTANSEGANYKHCNIVTDGALN